MKKSVCAFFPFILCLSLFGQTKVSPLCEDLIDRFFDLRMEYSIYDTKRNPNEMMARMDLFEEEIQPEVEQLNREEQLVIKSYIVNERFGVLIDHKDRKSELKKMMKNHLNVMEAFAKENRSVVLSKWFLVNRADTMSCAMVFSFGDVLKYGMQIKPLYEQALEQDPEFWAAYMNIAQWYYYAPGVFGGSKKKAEDLARIAYELSERPSEIYWTAIYYSQMMYQNKKKEEAAEMLAIAEACYPQSQRIRTIKEQNALGRSFFEYAKDKTDVAKELPKEYR